MASIGCSNTKSLLAPKHSPWHVPWSGGMCDWEAGYYLHKGMDLQARFFDEMVIFFHSIMLIIHREKAFLFPISSLKYWRYPCFHDALNLFHIVLSFLNSLFEIMNTIGDLNDIIPNTCSPKETAFIKIAHSGRAKGVVVIKDRDFILVGFIRHFCTGQFVIIRAFSILAISLSHRLWQPWLWVFWGWGWCSPITHRS